MVRNLIVISDTHAGCQFGLYPSDYKLSLDGGGFYKPSKGQKQVYEIWKYFWSTWVKTVTKGEPYGVVFNGDMVDGEHHQNKTHITNNFADQANIAYELLAPVVDKAEKSYYIRGTESHGGSSAEQEEQLSQRLGCIPDNKGKHSRWDLWIEIMKSPVHICHTIQGTGVTSYESTAVLRELIEAFNEAGRWKDKPPDCVVRSHRHRCIEVRIPAGSEEHHSGYATSLITGCWQLKTPYFTTGRVGRPHIGGHLIRYGDEDFLFTRFYIERGRQRKPEVL
jgi:hypothetical protein